MNARALLAQTMPHAQTQRRRMVKCLMTHIAALAPLASPMGPATTRSSPRSMHNVMYLKAATATLMWTNAQVTLATRGPVLTRLMLYIQKSFLIATIATVRRRSQVGLATTAKMISTNVLAGPAIRGRALIQSLRTTHCQLTTILAHVLLAGKA